MLVKKDIEGLTNGGSFETVALVKSYEIKPTKNGGKYISGVLEMQGSMPFKVWAGKLYDDLDKYEYQGMICQIKGKVDEYNGVKSVILSSVVAMEEGSYNESDFLEIKYNQVEYKEALDGLIKKRCSPEIQNLYQEIMGTVEDRFVVEFAAKSHHDAVKSGLLAHTYKVTLIMARVVKIYPHLCKAIDLDLLYLGCVLHDIGKVFEYTNGAIKGNGLLVSHRTFGVELVAQFKDKIVAVKDEEFYYRLLAIIEQHHGEYEETPRAVEAFLVHMADMMESQLQILDEAVENEVSPININGFRLH